MKKFMLVALALVIGTASVMAKDFTPEPKKEIRTQIVKLLDTPNFTLQEDINVLVTFTFSSEGEIVVLDINSKRREVLKYVRKNLNYKKIQNPGERDKLYEMPLTIAAVTE